VLTSTNAIHLYDDIPNTLRSWARVLSPGGVVRINSGNVQNPRARENEWIIDAVLGWVGGSVKVDGRTASDDAAADRLALLREALDVIFGGRPTFFCCWTYITAMRR
jgi:ubiquinone/menaquinone biosynthesis C-methylase UbiE